MLALLVLGYVVLHAVGILLCFSWSSLWLFGCMQLWKQTLTESYSNVFMAMYVWSFLLIWSTGALFAAAVGVGEGFQVLASLVAPILDGRLGLVSRLDAISLRWGVIA